jgi:hypothetical protein
MRETVFGVAPADINLLVSTFLNDHRFIITSKNSYNMLGVGTTQLYNETIIYNYKRHGTFEIEGFSYKFHSKKWLPSKITQEFLLVDLVNNIDQLAEDKQKILSIIKIKITNFNEKELREIIHLYGTSKTKKFFKSLNL